MRPADGAETVVAWKMAMENTSTPTALILSRQNIADLPARGASRYAEAGAATRGAYVVADAGGTPDVVLVANGSEVSTLVEAAQALSAEDKLKVRIVSVISDALFAAQPESYRESVLPFGVPTFGLTAGLPVALAGVVGPLGTVVGLTRFGASAPYKVLDEKFGYTKAAVVPKVRAYLKEYPARLARIAALAREVGQSGLEGGLGAGPRGPLADGLWLAAWAGRRSLSAPYEAARSARASAGASSTARDGAP